MENIQEYIDLLKAEKAKAEKSAQLFIDCGDNDYTDYHRGLVEAFALSITKAELLLSPKLNNDGQPQLNKHDVSGQLPLADIQAMLIEAHNHLAKSGLSIDDYTPISSALCQAKLKLHELI